MMEENDSSNANGEETEEQKSLFWKSRRKTNALSKKLLPKLRNTLLRPYMHNQHSSDDDDDSFEMKHDESFGANVEIGENGLVIVRSSSDAVVADRNAARRGERKEMEGSNFYDGDGNDDGDDNDDDITTHFCFLVHGYRGTPNHLSYLQSKMVNVASETLSQGKVNTSSHSTPLLRKHEQHQQLVMYRCRCNMNRTSDGIERGGERIYEEVLSVIRSFIRDKQELRRSSRNKEEREIASVTISMVGNSLGGLYSRYALAKLSELSKKQQQTYHNGNNKRIIENEGKESNSFIVIDGTIRIYFNIFCSTASPHLGVSGHTWFPIPRTAEIGLAQAMGDTGHDLFRLNDLIKTMCTTPKFLKPLSLFQKRIAYANAYHTDFAVPTQTAAFLNSESSYPHHLCLDDIISSSAPLHGVTSTGNEVENNAEDMNVEDNDNIDYSNGDTNHDDAVNKYIDDGLIVARLYTPQGSLKNKKRKEDATNTMITNAISCTSVSTAETTEMEVSNGSKLNDELLEMSLALDELGWEKVFVDIRSTLPSSPIPNIAKKWLVNQVFSYTSTSSKDGIVTSEVAGNSSLTTSSSSTLSSSFCNYSNENNHTVTTSTTPKRYLSLESKDVANAFSSPDYDLPFPLGHNMLVAVAGNRMNEFIYKGGRPVMDKLGKRLVEEILSWQRR